ncbi:hypothetical protein AKO1_010890 [Acrasis kona]|uniref:Uncharacterized protein n=1 Tax=Acrasis kona TaxID=1008807 RepID=A0AAW2YGW4_9EUKA
MVILNIVQESLIVSQLTSKNLVEIATISPPRYDLNHDPLHVKRMSESDQYKRTTMLFEITRTLNSIIDTRRQEESYKVPRVVSMSDLSSRVVVGAEGDSILYVHKRSEKYWEAEFLLSAINVADAANTQIKVSEQEEPNESSFLSALFSFFFNIAPYKERSPVSKKNRVFVDATFDQNDKLITLLDDGTMSLFDLNSSSNGQSNDQFSYFDDDNSLLSLFLYRWKLYLLLLAMLIVFILNELSISKRVNYAREQLQRERERQNGQRPHQD